MIRAIGFSDTVFQPKDPGRLCRGRERWIEPYDLEEDVRPIHRIVVSGATFSDDGAADARRGIAWSGLDVAGVIGALYPRKKLLAFMEDGHPADIPPDARGVEAYEGYRAGGRTEVGLVRWHLEVGTLKQLRELLGDLPADERVRGFVVLDGEVDEQDLSDRIFRLVGLSTLDSPPARYQPSALPDLLAVAKAVVLLHRDKHGPVVAVYASEPIPKLDEKLEKLCEKEGILLVPFAIPPMLARWDRALAELRDGWAAEHADPFPVPKAVGPPFRDRRRRRGNAAEDEEEVGENLDDASGQEDAVEE